MASARHEDATRSISFGSVTVTDSAALNGPVLVPAHSRARDSVRLHIVERGMLAQRLVPQGTARVARAGSAFATLDPHRVEMHAIDHCRIVSVAAPAALVGDIGLPTDSAHAISPKTPLLPPVAAFVRHALDVSDDLTSFNHYYFERLIQEMLVGVLVDSTRVTHVPRPPETFTLALSIITAQLSDSSLSASGIAREVNLSLRQLERVFRGRGTTVGGEIRRARVAHAISLLTGGSYATLTVDQIAGYAGFSNGSSLARAMAAEGHASPARVREARHSVRVSTPQNRLSPYPMRHTH